MAEKRTSDAVEILRRRYIKDDAERLSSVAAEKVNAEVARLVCDLRTAAGLTQEQLAERVGTTQSAISRLEDSDYEGHSLSMLNRIATALNQKLRVVMIGKDPDEGTLRYAFRVLVQDLRRKKGLTIEKLASKTGLETTELEAMERAPGYRPRPRTLHVLSDFYGVPTRRLAALVGTVREVPEDVRESASRFAAQSGSFRDLTKEEKRALDDFVKALR
jgi:transcriptional regulator with XRE-family HTH domain